VQTADGDALEAILACTDARFGPFGPAQRARLGGGEPAWWFCSVPLARFPIGNRFSTNPAAGTGTSIDADEALWRALGEAVERYSALNASVAGERVPLGDTGLADRLPICAPDEPCAPSLRDLPLDTPLLAVPVRRLADQRDMLLAAGFVHLNYAPESPDPLVTLPISTGLAFHRDLPTAIWTGFCEVAERDAVMLLWWCRSPLPEIVCDGPGVPEELADRLERLAHAGLTTRLFDMTTDIRIPSVFCVVTGESYPHLVVSACCRGDPARACMKALDETIAMRIALRGRDEDGKEGPTDPSDIRRLEDHAAFYARAPAHVAFDFLLAQPKGGRVSFDEFAHRDWWDTPKDMVGVGRFADRLEALDLTVLWTDLTAPDTADLGTVVKVIVPEMVPLSPDHAIRWLGTPRLLTWAGCTRASSSFFNPFPHPFA
jgi:ribosomal protein S12 methylthiotransferase accessory factor